MHNFTHIPAANNGRKKNTHKYKDFTYQDEKVLC